MSNRYRKKPVVIEAEQYLPTLPLPFRDGGNPVCYGIIGPLDDAPCFYVETVEGPLRVSDGDWIIRGVKGEFYPCKPDIFEATYEKVEP
jgi:hypothetical protein